MNKAMLYSHPQKCPTWPPSTEGKNSYVYDIIWVFQTNGFSTVFQNTILTQGKELFYPVSHKIFFEKEYEQAILTNTQELVEMCIYNS